MIGKGGGIYKKKKSSSYYRTIYMRTLLKVQSKSLKNSFFFKKPVPKVHPYENSLIQLDNI